jgi:GTPase
MTFEGLRLIDKIVPENDIGNIEYKLRLDSKDMLGCRKLVSQMLWRLNQGREFNDKYEAHYVLGVYDDGTPGKLSDDELNDTINIFHKVVNKAGLRVVFDNKYVIADSTLYFATLNKKPIDQKINEKYILILGSCCSGKTTLISKLSYDGDDDGVGRARSLILRHEHEKISGHTSSLKKEIFGLKEHNVINYTVGLGLNWEGITKTSDMVVNIFDTPGNSKYIRTTLWAISSIYADHIFITIDGTDIEKDKCLISFYIEYAIATKTPYTILISKMDMCENETDLIEKFVSCFGSMHSYVLFSNITNRGISEILHLIKLSPKCDTLYTSDTKFTILETFEISDTGTVVTGILNSGEIYLGQRVKLINNYVAAEAEVKSIHKKQISHQRIYAGESGAIQIAYIGTNPHINKHSIIIGVDDGTSLAHDFIIRVADIKDIRDKKYYLFTGNNTFNIIVVKTEGCNIYVKTELDTPVVFEPNKVCILKDDLSNLIIGYIDEI